MKNRNIGIYIHIPFCISKCYYCNFVSYDNMDNYIEAYINALCKEILLNSEILSEHTISSIYFGGGTPSYIDAKYIQKIMDTLNIFLNDKNIEITIEVNPNSINKEKLKIYYESGINRLSIGLQSTEDETLKLIGRKHSFKDCENAIILAKELGFNNISIDLIYPLPGLNISNFKQSIDKILKLDEKYNINHISVYNLEIHEESKLKFLIDNNFIKLVDEDIEMEMKRILEDTLINNGYIDYEISNFSRMGYESKHNLLYWNQEEYLSMGVNASSFLNATRWNNISNITEYIDRINNNMNITQNKQYLDKEELMNEYVILKLRLKEGISEQEFYTKYKENLFDKYKNIIKKHIDNGLLCIEKKECKRIKLTQKGKDLANLVWQDFV